MSKLSYADLTGGIIAAAIDVHNELGPGLLESAYQACLAREFELCGISHEQQVSLPVVYKDLFLDCGYRLDFVVGDSVIVEIKSVEALNEAHEAQCLTYLKFSKKPVCLLINFNTLRLKDGIRRFAGESNLRQIQRVPGEP